MKLLALHGFLGSSLDFSGLKDYLAIKDLWAPDLFGRDQGLLDSDFKTAAAHILKAVDAKWAHEPIHLLGYSFGGRLALHLALLYPLRFEKVILLSTHPGIFESYEITQRRSWEKRWLEKLDTLSLPEFSEEWQAQEIFKYDEPLALNLKELHLAALKKSFLHFSNTQHQFSPAELTRLERSLTWVCGEKDLKFLQVMKSVQKQRGDKDQFIIRPGQGHRLIAGEDWSWLCQVL